MISRRVDAVRPWRKSFIRVVGLLLLIATTSTTTAQSIESPAELDLRISRLIQKLGDDSADIRDEARTALLNIGPAAADQLFAATRDQDPTRRQAATEVFRVVAWAKAGLKFVSQIKRQELHGAVTLVLSPDGNFVYVPAHVSASINVFHRDSSLGRLTHRQSIEDAENLQGVLTLRLNSEGKLAVAAACRSKSIVLYSRNQTTGELTLASMRRQSESDGELKEVTWPTEAIFSTDDRFVYVVDDKQGTVLVFRIASGNRLDLVEIFHGPDGCLVGSRGVTANPDGKYLYVTSGRSGRLAVLHRDGETGKVGIHQILRDEEDGVHGLDGVVESCVSRDGKFVYTISGRFTGDDAISVFQRNADGQLRVIQEFINEKSELKEFLGGANGLAISPDGKRFYASGTKSQSLACFDRDLESGKLTYVTTLKNGMTGNRENPLEDLGANGIDVSADGKFVYLALEEASAISVLERTTTPPQP